MFRAYELMSLCMCWKSKQKKQPFTSVLRNSCTEEFMQFTGQQWSSSLSELSFSKEGLHRN